MTTMEVIYDKMITALSVCMDDNVDVYYKQGFCEKTIEHCVKILEKDIKEKESNDGI